jgi:hypothetical protein
MINQADAAAARQFFEQNGRMGLMASPVLPGNITPLVASGSGTPNAEFERWQEQFQTNSASFQDSMKPPGISSSVWAAELERFKSASSSMPMQAASISKLS